MPLVYLAGAIDRAKGNPKDWSKELIAELHERWSGVLPERAPLITYSPALGFDLSGACDTDHGSILFDINMKAVDLSSLVMVRYTPGVETWGTPMEVLRAFMIDNTPVLVWTVERLAETYIDAEDLLPSYLAAFAYEGRCYTNLQSAVAAAIGILIRESFDIRGVVEKFAQTIAVKMQDGG